MMRVTATRNVLDKKESAKSELFEKAHPANHRECENAQRNRMMPPKEATPVIQSRSFTSAIGPHPIRRWPLAKREPV